MHNKARESAISEVVGTLLMVGLTVFMGAIIVAYIFGFVNGGITVTRIISVTAQEVSPSVIEVTYRGGSDQVSLQNFTIIWPDGTQQLVSSPKIGGTYRATNINATILNVTPGDNDRVLVIGRFVNDVTQIVLDTKV